MVLLIKTTTPTLRKYLGYHVYPFVYTTITIYHVSITFTLLMKLYMIFCLRKIYSSSHHGHHHHQPFAPICSTLLVECTKIARRNNIHTRLHIESQVTKENKEESPGSDDDDDNKEHSHKK